MYYQTRSHLTKTDVEFIGQAIDQPPSQDSSLHQLINDPEIITDLLHDKRLLERSLTIPPLLLSISPQLFFYIFVYHALEQKNITDDDLTDYIAGVCVEFRDNQALRHFTHHDGGKTIYMVDLLTFMNDLNEGQQYHLHRYIGNATLFLTGFFPDFIFKRNRNIGAPPMTYYKKIGRGQFEQAAGHSLRYDEDAGPVLSVLAERFADIRVAMNLFVDEHLSLNKAKHSLAMIERQAATLDEESFRQSLMM